MLPDDAIESLNEAARHGQRWIDFRDRARNYVAAGVARVMTEQPVDSAARLLALRRLHDIVYVAHRVRNAAILKRRAVPDDLSSVAARILAKANRNSARADRRSLAEEQFVTGAKVNWHKLVKRTELTIVAEPAPDVSTLRAQVIDSLTTWIRTIERAEVANAASVGTLHHLADSLRDCLERVRDSQKVIGTEAECQPPSAPSG